MMKIRATEQGRCRVLPLVLILLSTGLMVTGCGESEQAAQQQAPPVTVANPEIRDIQDYSIFTGSSRAAESAEVVARVAGTLESVEFKPSAEVKAGDLLFTIEATRYQAAYDSAVASLRSAEADLLRAETELKRVEKASRSRAVSEMDVDRSKADRDMAKARVSSAQAALDEAALNLSYTQVVSPIDGVVSRNLVDAGNLVGQSGPTVLTRVNNLQPMYVYFYAPESVVLRFLAYRSQMEGKNPRRGGQAEARVELANETGFPHYGVIDFIDNEVDARTGTIELRVRLENENHSFFPGLFVRVRVTGRQIPDAILVPETCIGSDLGGKFVLTVGEDNLVETKYVTLGSPQEDGTIHVMEGLEGNETIVVQGLAFARPGMPVTPLTAEQYQAMIKQKMAEKAQAGK